MTDRGSSKTILNEVFVKSFNFILVAIVDPLPGVVNLRFPCPLSLTKHDYGHTSPK